MESGIQSCAKLSILITFFISLLLYFIFNWLSSLFSVLFYSVLIRSVLFFYLSYLSIFFTCLLAYLPTYLFIYSICSIFSNCQTFIPCSLFLALHQILLLGKKISNLSNDILYTVAF